MQIAVKWLPWLSMLLASLPSASTGVTASKRPQTQEPCRKAAESSALCSTHQQTLTVRVQPIWAMHFNKLSRYFTLRASSAPTISSIWGVEVRSGTSGLVYIHSSWALGPLQEVLNMYLETELRGPTEPAMMASPYIQETTYTCCFLSKSIYAYTKRSMGRITETLRVSSFVIC